MKSNTKCIGIEKKIMGWKVNEEGTFFLIGWSEKVWWKMTRDNVIPLFRILNFFFIYASRYASPQACFIFFKMIWKACIYYKKNREATMGIFVWLLGKLTLFGVPHEKHQNWLYIYVLVIIRCCRALHKQTFNLHRCVTLYRVSRV